MEFGYKVDMTKPMAEEFAQTFSSIEEPFLRQCDKCESRYNPHPNRAGFGYCTEHRKRIEA